MIVMVCILEEFEQGAYKGCWCWWCSTLKAVVAISNRFDGEQGASADRPELA